MSVRADGFCVRDVFQQQGGRFLVERFGLCARQPHDDGEIRVVPLARKGERPVQGRAQSGGFDFGGLDLF